MFGVVLGFGLYSRLAAVNPLVYFCGVPEGQSVELASGLRSASAARVAGESASCSAGFLGAYGGSPKLAA